MAYGDTIGALDHIAHHLGATAPPNPALSRITDHMNRTQIAMDKNHQTIIGALSHPDYNEDHLNELLEAQQKHKHNMEYLKKLHGNLSGGKA